MPQTNGFLTKQDQAYLLKYANIDAKSQQERDTRQRIRNRVRNAITDFSIVMAGLREDDRQQVFHPEHDDNKKFNDGLADTLGFIYLGSVGRVPKFETLLSRGVNQAEHLLADSAARNYNVEFNAYPTGASNIDFEATAEKIRAKQFDALDEEEMRYFIRFSAEAGTLDPDAPAELIQERFEEFVEQETEAMEQRNERARKQQLEYYDTAGDS